MYIRIYNFVFSWRFIFIYLKWVIRRERQTETEGERFPPTSWFLTKCPYSWHLAGPKPGAWVSYVHGTGPSTGLPLAAFWDAFAASWAESRSMRKKAVLWYKGMRSKFIYCITMPILYPSLNEPLLVCGLQDPIQIMLHLCLQEYKTGSTCWVLISQSEN